MTPSASKKSDISLLNKTLFRLALPRIIFRSIVIIIAITIWAWITLQILDFGTQQDYAFLQNYSTELADYLNSINKYIWWGLVIIGTVILYFLLTSYLEESLNKAGSIVPKQAVMENLLPQLSPSTKEILIWVWGDQKEPITLKNLYDTRRELHSGQANRINQIKQQRALLGIAHQTTHQTIATESNKLVEPPSDIQIEEVQQLLADISLDLNDSRKPE